MAPNATAKKRYADVGDNLRHPTKGIVAVYLAAGWSNSRIAATLGLTPSHVWKIARLPCVKARVDELHTRLLFDLAREEMDK